MARAAILKNIVQVLSATATTIECQYGAVFCDPSLGGESMFHEDGQVIVTIDLNATPAQLEVAVREAMKARGQALTGDAWANNDIYQFNIRRA